MKIALAQINTTVADLPGNVDRCLDAIRVGQKQGADLIVLPEMAVPGYPPRDILLDTSFIAAVGEATQDLARRAAGLPSTIVGTLHPGGIPTPGHPALHNVATLLKSGRARIVAVKRLLPTYDVFHEQRWFVPGPQLPPIEVAGAHIGVLICEDLWDEAYLVHPPVDLVNAGAQALVSISASPYRHGVLNERLYHARRAGCPVIHVNLCGATDELIFDGRSFALDSKGALLAQLPGFEEAVQVVDLSGGESTSPTATDNQQDLYRALVLGIHDFAHKNGIHRAFLGLSGGIDSAVVAILAAEALGPDCVTALAIPGRFTDPRSNESAATLAHALGIGFEIVPLEPLHAAAEKVLGELLSHGTTGENLQARLRMVILMSFVNRHGGLLLNTSNKTELALGYGTLYGDLAGTLSPLGDLTKPEVYALAHWIQERRAIIPSFILERAPSAELKPDQVDPFDYPVVGPALERLIQANCTNAILRQTEHKRWHMGVVLKVSRKAFGTGRMMPITRR